MILDLFAGPGGWDEGLRSLRPDLHATLTGVELELQTTWTRRDAGHRTIRADVASLAPERAREGAVTGIIASPPCQPFSQAAANRPVRGFADPRGLLTHEPGRYVRALRPGWVALEQVPQVLPVWEVLAGELGRLGYSTWVGTLNAADYGVPQRRRRAVLLASRERLVRPPAPTHVGRHMSVAEALGLTEPTHVRTRGASTSGGNVFPASEPSWALTSKARSWFLVPGNPTSFARDRSYALDRPAPTVNFGRSGGHWQWRNDEGESRRLTQEEALVLQGFRRDYPLRGSRTSRFMQLGQAVPPPLAEACLRAVTPLPPLVR